MKLYWMCMKLLLTYLLVILTFANASDTSVPIATTVGDEAAVCQATAETTTTASNASEDVSGALGNCYNDTDSSDSRATMIPFPPMPAGIRALLHGDWDELDEDGANRMQKVSAVQSAVEFAHARTTFLDHLKGTFGILGVWGQPSFIMRTGLMHTSYSGDLFQFFLFDVESENERAIVKDILGEEAEALTYLFGTINRGMLIGFRDVVERNATHALPLLGPQYVRHRLLGEDFEVSARDTAAILMVTIADYLDQFVETNGWRDHHQIEAPDRLYPGDGRPALGFYWFTAVCNAIRGHLDVIPSVFDHCNTVLDIRDEEIARDKYWEVVLHEHELSLDQKTELLNESVRHNPFVGEPHLMLSQLYYSNADYELAGVEAAQALDKFYKLASAWDKRRSFEHWLGFARIMLLRSNRKLRGEEHSLPTTQRGLTSLREVVQEMEAMEGS